MIVIPKRGNNDVKFDIKRAKDMDYVIIVNDKESSNTGDLFSMWNQKCNVCIASDISDLYDFLIANFKKIDSKKNFMITGAKNTSRKLIQEYKNLLAFFLFYKDELKVMERGMNRFNKKLVDKKDNPIVRDSFGKLAFMNNNGKYLRGVLISLGYKIASLKDDSYYFPLAVSYETFQTSILIHDDIIDNAKIRRGKKTIPVKYEEKFDKYDGFGINEFNEDKKHIANSLGVCIGDLGFYLSNLEIVKNYGKDENFDRLLEYYNSVVINTIKGEIIDVYLPFSAKYNSKHKVNEHDILDIYHLKTAWYSVIGPLSLGMILGGASSKNIEKVEKPLDAVGVAFQIKDDILGIFGSEKKLGKSVISDISEYKQTLLYKYVLDTDYKEDFLKYYGKNALSREEIKNIKNIFIKSGALDRTTDMMNSLFSDAKVKIAKNSKIPTVYREILLGFVSYLELRER